MSDETNYSILKKIQKFLDFKPRTRLEIKNKLKSLNLSELEIDSFISFLEEKNIINDRDYAFSQFEYLYNVKKYPLEKIKAFLSSKGIDDDLINEIINSYEHNDTDQCMGYILRKFKKQDDKEKILKHCLRKGFSYSDIINAINSLNNENNK